MLARCGYCQGQVFPVLHLDGMRDEACLQCGRPPAVVPPWVDALDPDVRALLEGFLESADGG